METSNPAYVGTAGGTFLSVLPNLPSEDFVNTILLATIGAIVSFGISMALKSIMKKRKK